MVEVDVLGVTHQAALLADEVAHDDRLMNAGWGLIHDVRASKPGLYGARAGAAVAVSVVAVVAGFVVEALAISTHGFAYAVYATGLVLALITAVERERVAVVALLPALHELVAASRRRAGEGRGSGAVVGADDLTISGAARLGAHGFAGGVFALFAADEDAVAALGGGAGQAHHFAAPAGFGLARLATAVARSGVAVVTLLVAGDYGITALYGGDAGLAGRRTSEVDFDLLAVGSAAVARVGVAVVAHFAVDVEQ